MSSIFLPESGIRRVLDEEYATWLWCENKLQPSVMQHWFEICAADVKWICFTSLDLHWWLSINHCNTAPTHSQAAALLVQVFSFKGKKKKHDSGYCEELVCCLAAAQSQIIDGWRIIGVLHVGVTLGHYTLHSFSCTSEMKSHIKTYKRTIFNISAVINVSIKYESVYCCWTDMCFDVK